MAECDFTDRHGDRAYALSLFLASGTTDSLMFNVLTHGVTGNGTTDDTAAINALLASVPAGSIIYFPAGTYIVSPTNHHMVVITKKNITLQGASRDASIIKVKDSVGNYNSVISDGRTTSPYIDISGLTIRDLTLDQNYSHNPITSVATGSPFVTTDPRYGVRVFNGFDITANNVHFTNVDSINTFVCNGGETAIRRTRVLNCLFDNIGPGVVHDHSSIYFHGDGLLCVGNEFIGIGPAAITAIETHGSNQMITNNTVRNYLCGVNLTGVSNSNSRNMTVRGNAFQNMGSGIMLWAYKYGLTSGEALSEAIISENVIDINVDAWQLTPAVVHSGIALNNASDGVCRAVKITDNLITYRAFSSTPNLVDQLSTGVLWWRSSAVTLGTEEVDIEIARNTIKGSLGPGINFDTNIPSKRIRILDNVVLNPGLGTANAVMRCGIRLVAAAHAGEDILVARNMIVDNAATHILDTGINSQFWAAAITDGRMVDNQVRCADGANPPVSRGHVSVAWYSRQQMTTYVANAGPWAAGSSIVDMSTGATYTQTTAPSGSAWSSFSPSGLRGNRFTFGLYYSAPDVRGAATAVVMTANLVYYAPFYVTETATFDRIGVTVTTAQAGTAIRLGIYADSGHGSPAGAPLLDAGTVDSATGAASVEATISKQLPPGLYWLAAVSQGGTTQPSVSQSTVPAPQVGGGSLASGVIGRSAYSQTGVTGALTTYAAAGAVAFTPIIAMRVISIP